MPNFYLFLAFLAVSLIPMLFFVPKFRQNLKTLIINVSLLIVSILVSTFIVSDEKNAAEILKQYPLFMGLGLIAGLCIFDLVKKIKLNKKTKLFICFTFLLIVFLSLNYFVGPAPIGYYRISENEAYILDGTIVTTKGGFIIIENKESTSYNSPPQKGKCHAYQFNNRIVGYICSLWLYHDYMIGSFRLQKN